MYRYSYFIWSTSNGWAYFYCNPYIFWPQTFFQPQFFVHNAYQDNWAMLIIHLVLIYTLVRNWSLISIIMDCKDHFIYMYYRYMYVSVDLWWSCRSSLYVCFIDIPSRLVYLRTVNGLFVMLRLYGTCVDVEYGEFGFHLSPRLQFRLHWKWQSCWEHNCFAQSYG